MEQEDGVRSHGLRAPSSRILPNACRLYGAAPDSLLPDVGHKPLARQTVCTISTTRPPSSGRLLWLCRNALEACRLKRRACRRSLADRHREVCPTAAWQRLSSVSTFRSFDLYS